MTESELQQKLLTSGYVTAVDAPEVDQDDAGHELRDKLDKALLDQGKDPYIVYELFDFQKGVIKGIIFNMDIIKTRQAAMDKLSEITKNPEIKLTKEAEEEVNEIGKAGH